MASAGLSLDRGAGPWVGLPIGSLLLPVRSPNAKIPFFVSRAPGRLQDLG